MWHISLPAKALYLKQNITITGFGSSSFQDDMAGIDGMLDSLAQNKVVLPMMEGRYDRHHTLTFSSRYFTRRRHSQSSEHHPFSDGVDPAGDLEILRQAAGNLIHHQDNIVEYGTIFYQSGKRR